MSEGLFKIEKVDIPPPAGGSEGGQSKYPWEEMGDGDSFFVEIDDEKKAAAKARNLYKLGVGHLNRNGKEDWSCITRKEKQSDGTVGIRIWFKAPSEIKLEG